jgi:prepilin peptidase CpaA
VLGFVVLVLAAVLFYSAGYDVVNRKIPNWMSICIFVLFMLAAFIQQMSWADFGTHLLVGLGVFVAGAILFYLNVWGGGDVKLLAACSLWFGTAAVGPLLYGVAIGGGIVALILVLIKRLQIEINHKAVRHWFDPKRGVPYAVAIVIGVFVAAPKAAMFSALM